MAEETKYCCNCKHFLPSSDSRGLDSVKFGRCKLFPSTSDVYHLASPEIHQEFQYINVARKDYSGEQKMCGTAGERYEEARQP